MMIWFVRERNREERTKWDNYSESEEKWNTRKKREKDEFYIEFCDYQL